MFFSLDVLRARKGDCLVLHFGAAEPRLIMIDGGPSNVYRPHLKPRLERLRQQRGVEAGQPLVVDALLVSHVDDDHIKGILELTQELRDAKNEQKPLPVRVRSLWHNSFDEILATTPEQLQRPAQFGAAALSGEIPIDDDLSHDVAQILASVPQGNQLRVDAEFLQWPVNRELGGELVMATGEPSVAVLGEILKLTVVGPLQDELAKLQKSHDEWLRNRAKGEGDGAEETLAAYKDESVPNLSSIVLLAEVDGRRMLLTGDARGDKILKGLELVGSLRAGGKMHVDLLKVPHHGSANNLDHDFFERITADHYVFSGDGEHGNPEREALQMLLDARGDAGYTIHFTYSIEEIDAARQADWLKERKREEKKKNQNSKKKVRPDWSPQKQSLAAFFAEHTGLAENVQIVQTDKPHVIDLAEPLGEA
jgi:hypothetical protein